MKLNWGIFKASETSKNNPQLNLLKCVQENVPDILWKYWQEVKSKPIFFVSQLERCCHVSLRELFDLREDRSFQSFPFLFLSWLAGILRARRQDKDGVQINVHLKYNLDREDCTSLRFPFILPYAWISRRDSCLVGVSCHIPSFW